MTRIDEVRGYLASFKSPSFLDSTSNMNDYKSLDKDLYSLLLWGLELNVYGKEDLSRNLLHLRECISDTSTANLCCLLGLHKPGLMSLRSGIENFVKFSLARTDEALTDTTSVYELNRRFKKLFAQFPPEARSSSTGLIDKYSELCKFAHSHSAEYMSLATFYEETISRSDDVFRAGVLEISAVCHQMNSLCLLLVGKPKNLHRSNYDHILDRAPRTIKRCL